MEDDIVPADFDVDFNNGDSDTEFPVGQYKGRLIASCDDEKYLQWLWEQDWFEEKYPLAYEAVEARMLEL